MTAAVAELPLAPPDRPHSHRTGQQGRMILRAGCSLLEGNDTRRRIRTGTELRPRRRPGRIPTVRPNPKIAMRRSLPTVHPGRSLAYTLAASGVPVSPLMSSAALRV
ncbi:hypothetical protein GCM10010440_75540 [Kitasatospora cinereorecta]